MSIPLFCPDQTDESNRLLLANLTQQHELQRVAKPTDKPCLIVDQGRLGLIGQQWPKVKPVFVDFLSGVSEHRRMQGGGTGQAVAKAIGLKKQKHLKVIDATAGLGRDAFVLASLGAQVEMYERHPVVRLLLQDGLDRLSLTADADLQAIAERLELKGTDFQQAEPDSADIIYLDPMFPERKKQAKVKKDMALFHELIGEDLDADNWLAPALAMARYRVVVKRPKSAPDLNGQAPTTRLVGKANRFDIYSLKAIPS